MDLTMFFLAFTLFWKNSSGVKCYMCEPRSSDSPRPPCEEFDGSNRYIEDCNTSTMCFKKQSTIDFGNGKTTTYQRGCASQTMSGDQRKINGTWKFVTKIYEVYEEKCKEDADPVRLTNTVHCYCRGDLCNSASKIDSAFTILAFVILTIMFNYKFLIY